MSEEVTLVCGYCNKLIDPPTEAVIYHSDKFRYFHPGKCHEEARKDSKKHGIEDFKSLYGPGDLNRSK